MIYEKPSHVLKELYSLLSKEVCWQTYFRKLEILKKDNFIRRYCTGLFDYVRGIGSNCYSMEDAYAYVLSEANKDNQQKLTPTMEDFKRLLDFPPVFRLVCAEYYNNPKDEPVITLLKHINENLSLFAFHFRYIPKMYNFLNPTTTRFIYPLYVSRVILDDIIFESFDNDFIGKRLQLDALPILFVESLGTQFSHSLADGYKGYIIEIYKKKPIRRNVEKLVHAIFYNQSLSDRDKKALIKKIDSLDEKRWKIYKEELPNTTYYDLYYPKGPHRPYIKFVSVPYGGQNKRY